MGVRLQRTEPYRLRLMEILPIEFFGVAVDVPFSTPLGFTQARLEEFGAKICDVTSGLNLRPDQIRLRRWDDLYGYELTAHFFGENGLLTRAADRVKLAIRNARTAADWNILHQTLLRFYTLMEFAPKSVTTLSAHVHAKFPAPDERDRFMEEFAHSPLIARAAALGYVQIADWEKEIRVLIEQSNVVPDALFVAWDTQFENEQDWDTFLGSLPTVMENSANLFDLGFEPFRQTA
jgi:hypothetical protein